MKGESAKLCVCQARQGGGGPQAGEAKSKGVPTAQGGECPLTEGAAHHRETRTVGR